MMKNPIEDKHEVNKEIQITQKENKKNDQKARGNL